MALTIPGIREPYPCNCKPRRPIWFSGKCSECGFEWTKEMVIAQWMEEVGPLQHRIDEDQQRIATLEATLGKVEKLIESNASRYGQNCGCDACDIYKAIRDALHPERREE